MSKVRERINAFFGRYGIASPLVASLLWLLLFVLILYVIKLIGEAVPSKADAIESILMLFVCVPFFAFMWRLTGILKSPKTIQLIQHIILLIFGIFMIAYLFIVVGLIASR